jgi:hypothetical protein
VEIIYTDKDGATVKFTEEMAIAAITERDELRTQLSDCQVRSAERYGKILDIRDKVREFFQERSDGDDDEITCTVDDINELLKSIGSDELKRLWTVIGTINYTVTNISASSEDEANDYVMNELTVDVISGDADLDDWSIDISSTEQQ